MGRMAASCACKNARARVQSKFCPICGAVLPSSKHKALPLAAVLLPCHGSAGLSDSLRRSTRRPAVAQQRVARPKMYQIDGDRAELAADRIHRPPVDTLALCENKMTLRARAGREERQREATAELKKRHADSRARERVARAQKQQEEVTLSTWYGDLEWLRCLHAELCAEVQRACDCEVQASVQSGSTGDGPLHSDGGESAMRYSKSTAPWKAKLTRMLQLLQRLRFAFEALDALPKCHRCKPSASKMRWAARALTRAAQQHANLSHRCSRVTAPTTDNGDRINLPDTTEARARAARNRLARPRLPLLIRVAARNDNSHDSSTKVVDIEHDNIPALPTLDILDLREPWRRPCTAHVAVDSCGGNTAEAAAVDDRTVRLVRRLTTQEQKTWRLMGRALENEGKKRQTEQKNAITSQLDQSKDNGGNEVLHGESMELDRQRLRRVSQMRIADLLGVRKMDAEAHAEMKKMERRHSLSWFTKEAKFKRHLASDLEQRNHELQGKMAVSKVQATEVTSAQEATYANLRVSKFSPHLWTRWLHTASLLLMDVRHVPALELEHSSGTGSGKVGKRGIVEVYADYGDEAAAADSALATDKNNDAELRGSPHAILRAYDPATGSSQFWCLSSPACSTSKPAIATNATSGEAQVDVSETWAPPDAVDKGFGVSNDRDQPHTAIGFGADHGAARFARSHWRTTFEPVLCCLRWDDEAKEFTLPWTHSVPKLV